MTVDETLFAFRGRCEFRLYIPSKRAKYSINIQGLVDTKSFYTVNVEVYSGKQPTGPYYISNKAYDVVEKLAQARSRTNGNITFDNWVTSYELMMHLLNEHELTSTGTLRKKGKDPFRPYF